MKNILVVDDSPTMRRMVMTSLREIENIQYFAAQLFQRRMIGNLQMAVTARTGRNGNYKGFRLVWHIEAPFHVKSVLVLQADFSAITGQPTPASLKAPALARP